MNPKKITFYLDLVKKSHDAFRDFLLHLPEEILDWKINDFANSTRWLIEHVIHDQTWIANVILNSEEEGYHFEGETEDLTLESMIEEYEQALNKIETDFDNLSDEDLKEGRSYKEYTMLVEEWFFEYIHHLNQHAGELGLYLTVWKRKQRNLDD
ncbi:MAG: DinB family protein [Candidatus Heimdallarchaeaceae archaeon]|jgi:hypothetical protein